MRVNATIATALTVAFLTVAGGASASADTNKNSQPAPKPADKTVTVQAGDTLSNIGQNNNTTYVRIYDANANISDPNLIFPSESLKIPAANEQLPDRPLPTAAPAATTAPVAQPAAAPQTQAIAPAQPVYHQAVATAGVAPSGGVWVELAACESGGNWHINTGNGFYGGLQFDYGTWLSNGGGAYAPRADLASPAQQIAIASKVQAARGWSPWPGCSAKLGL